jgi:transcriptional regulator with XRE-family HTH domain
MELQTVGEIVRLLRGRRDMEQIALARACGWRDASAVSRIETDRIAPTRRTLLKLAESLAGDVNGSATEVRAWLFLAAGILPTREEVAAMQGAIPAIESWTQPALVMDLGWQVWRANPVFIHLLGFPPGFEGTNLLELIFGDAVRDHLGPSWRRAAAEALKQFRGETDHRAAQRWRRHLLADLQADADFKQLWNDCAPPDPNEIALRTRYSASMGSISMIRLTLAADPRLSIAQIVPEDQKAVQALAVASPPR